ncbi:MAG: prenyltransferase/squalene oxidase repeat-containing protein [Lawsonibacter sp.]|nr:prenyltransferase/squalene oxidase repeat-containing protein [Lawsonibacter sp.]
MKQPIRRLLYLLLTAALFSSFPAFAQSTQTDWHSAITTAAADVQRTVPNPQVGSVGGEWAVIGLACSGVKMDQAWSDTYLQNLTQTVTQQKGVLSTRQYTEYARVILALTAVGKAPRDVGGYDLLAPLEDFEQTTSQGINGAVFALIALDSGDYDAPSGLRDRYLQMILSAQLSDGGWSLSGGQADPDITAMALQALAPYGNDSTAVQEAISQGLARLDTLQKAGSFSTLESYSQTIIALCALGIQPEQSLLEKFLSFQRTDGSFSHTKGGPSNQMASEQGLCALAALARQEAGASSLYDTAGTKTSQSSVQAAAVIPGLAALIPAVLGVSPFLGGSALLGSGH